MFGGGAKKEKKEEEDRGDVSGSAKAQREAKGEEVCVAPLPRDERILRRVVNWFVRDGSLTDALL
jgi:hypothetical protein